MFIISFWIFIAIFCCIILFLEHLNGIMGKNYHNIASRRVSGYAFLRRFFYALRHKEFSKIDKDNYYLFNRNIILIYSFESDTFTVYNPKKPDIKVLIFEYNFYNIFDFIELFDQLLYSFTFDTTYDAVINFFKENDVSYRTYKRIKTTEKINANYNINTKTNKNEEIKKIDINFDSEKEIALLPGVNIITAKNVVKYRDLRGGFKNKDEFIKQLKVKEHFVEKIIDMIEIGECSETKNEKNGNEGRIVDFE